MRKFLIFGGAFLVGAFCLWNENDITILVAILLFALFRGFGFMFRHFLECKCMDIISSDMEYCGASFEDIYFETKYTSTKDLFKFYFDYLRG